METCFFCGSDDVDQRTRADTDSSVFESWRISCVNSVSVALGLLLTPSLQETMTRQAKYCGCCLGLMRDIDFFTCSVKRIQSGLSSKAAILRRQIRMNCERMAYSGSNPVPGSREYLLRKIIESKNEEVQRAGAASPDSMQEPQLVLDRKARTSTSMLTRKRFASMLRPDRAPSNKNEQVTPNKVSTVVRFEQVKQEAEEIPETDYTLWDDGDLQSLKASPDGHVSESEQSEVNDGDEDYVPPVAALSDDEHSVASEDEDQEYVPESPAATAESRPRKRACVVVKKDCPRQGCQFATTKDGLLALHIRQVHESDPKPFHCQHCLKQYRTSAGLVTHKSRRHGGKGAYQCGACSRSLTTQTALQNHAAKCPASAKSLTCPRRSCSFACRKEDPEDLAIHIRKVHQSDPRPFHCQYCDLKFKVKFGWQCHEKWHTGLGLFPCAHCQATFNRERSLWRHNKACTAERPKPPNNKVRSAREDPPTECEYENCQYIGNHVEIQAHVRTVHLGEAHPFPCSVCEKGFQTLIRLKAHENSVHVQRRGVPGHKCQFCEKAFFTAGQLKDHGESRHFLQLEHNLRVSCQACGKFFGTEDELHAHAGLHEAHEQPFACVLCDFVPNNSVDLKLHVRNTHEEAFPQCPKCLKRFKNIIPHVDTCKGKRAEPNLHCPACPYIGTSVKALTKHRIDKHGGGNFVCQQCGKRFFNEKSLRLHDRLHSGELPFACSVCDKRFGTRTVLKEHEQSHATHDSHFCPKCNKGFKTRAYMWQHLTMYCRLNPERRPPARSRNKQAEETHSTSYAFDYPTHNYTYV